MHHEIAPPGGVPRQGELDAQRRGDAGPPGVDVDQLDPDAGERARVPGHQGRDAAADHAGTDHGDPVADQWGSVPQGVHRGLHGAGQHRPRGRHTVGHRDHRAGRDHVRGLVRVQAEDGSTEQPGGTVLDDAHVEVAVLHRSGKFALLERRAHRGVLARGHAAGEDQGLGAPADAGVAGADEDLAGTGVGQRRRADLTLARCAQPERVGLARHGRPPSPGPPSEPYDRVSRVQGQGRTA